MSAETPPIARPGWVLLKLEAWERGFRRRNAAGEQVPNVLAFRRWCRRNGVPIRKTGKLETVCPADVDRAVLGDAPAPANDLASLAAASVARSIGGTH